MRVILLMAGALLLSSCQKETETPEPIIIIEQALTCNCANSTTLGAISTMNGYEDLINECTGNSIRIMREEMISSRISHNPDNGVTRYCLDRNW